MKKDGLSSDGLIKYRTLTMEDAGKFLDMMKQLDCETDFMMYEPGERDVTFSGLLGVQNMIRLELTMECSNTAAIRLYEKSGFIIEGIRRQSMAVDGVYVDEYYMAKLL